jgi:hypothetical protein
MSRRTPENAYELSNAGKREIIRILKRYVAREVYRQLPRG